jgi:dihydrofolate synthase/folylpolyglutamate synthase
MALFTTIGLDHTEVLGPTKEDIAREKSGIIMPGIRAISCAQDDAVVRVLREEAEEKKASLRHEGHDYRYEVRRVTDKGTTFDFCAEGISYEGLFTGLIGPHQAKNASLALYAVIAAGGYSLQEPLVRQALESVTLGARFQIVRQDPAVIVDGAHNIDSINAAFATLRMLYPGVKPVVVFGIARDKERAPILTVLARESEAIIVTTFAHYRAVAAPLLYEQVKAVHPRVAVCDFAHQALEYAFGIARPEKRPILIVGSFHLAKEVLALCEPEGYIE